MLIHVQYTPTEQQGCIKNIKTFSLEYNENKKNWMTSTSLENWVQKINKTF